MTDPSILREAVVAYGSRRTDLETPLILEAEGQPMAVVLSFEEYLKLRTLAADANERQQVARADLAALLSRVHDRPTQLTPQQIEDEITAARDEVRRQKRLKIEDWVCGRPPGGCRRRR